MGLIRTKHTVTSYRKFHKAFDFKYDTYFHETGAIFVDPYNLVSMWVCHLNLIRLCTAPVLRQKHVIGIVIHPAYKKIVCYSFIMLSCGIEIQLQNDQRLLLKI